MSAWQKDSGKRKVIQNNQIKWLLTCYISISSLCFHSQSAVLQGRKVHPQRRLSVSTIKWLNLLKALSSYPFYCCCNHCLEKHTSVAHVLVCESLNSSCKLSEQRNPAVPWAACAGIFLVWPRAVPHSPFYLIWIFPPQTFHLFCPRQDCNSLSIISSHSQNRLGGDCYS